MHGDGRSEERSEKSLKAVELQNVFLSYHSQNGEIPAVENLSFSVEEGEFISIVGPSGCGKSTLLSIIAGLLAPSGGDIYIYGKARTEGKISSSENGQQERYIGYMLQKDHLFEWRSILKNVCLGLEIQGKLNEETKEYVVKLLKDYGLYDFKDKMPSQLSGGMRQRAALIRTLAVKPDILLLDEPFSALDYQTRLYVSDEIGSIIRKQKKTAILVTHDISEAVSMADRVFVLSKRPAKLSAEHIIELGIESRTPMKTREAEGFRHYFNTIWKELDVHDSESRVN